MKRTILAAVAALLLFGPTATADPFNPIRESGFGAPRERVAALQDRRGASLPHVRVVSVPEPSILVMLGMGLFGLARQLRNRTIEIP